MAENNKTIIEEAMIDFKKIETALKASTKETIRSIMSEEIKAYAKESINEDYEEEEIEIDQPVDQPLDGMGDEVSELPLGGEEEVEVSDELPMDLDMTNASDEDVITIYKKLSGDDEIEVVSNGDIKFTEPESGNEYIIKLGGKGGETEIGDLEIEEPESELGSEIELELEPEAGDDGMDGEMELGNDNDNDEDEDELGESIVYEIELQDEDLANEDIIRGQGHDTYVKDISAPTGDIESVTAPVDSESGDNLTGGFDEDDTSGDGHAEHIMEEEGEEEEAIEEKIQVGKGRTVANTLTDIKGAGGKSNATNESSEKYKTLVKENEAFKVLLKKFKGMLSETVVFQSNLAHCVKLFTEHTTTKDEKKMIISRFDENSNSIKESEKLYKTIVSELTNKKTIGESVETKINKVGSSSKGQITETTAYVDKSVLRMRELMYNQNK